MYRSEVLMSTPNHIFVPIVRQAYEYSCGAASLASCLYYWGVWDGREPQLYSLLGTNEDGTSGNKIIEVAQGFKLWAQSRSEMSIDDLKKYISEGCTVILSIQSWGNYTEETDMNEIWEDGHYVVLVGFKGELVYMMDPSIPGMYRVMSIKELKECWHDYNDAGDYDNHSGIIIRGSESINSLDLVVEELTD
jgi:predicted double-glycine peptidase